MQKISSKNIPSGTQAVIHWKKKERWQIEAVRSEYLTATNVLAGSKFDCTATWITKVWKCHGNILDVQ